MLAGNTGRVIMTVFIIIFCRFVMYLMFLVFCYLARYVTIELIASGTANVNGRIVTTLMAFVVGFSHPQ